MPDKEHQLRKERLKLFFQGEDWEDLKEEIQQVYDNADDLLHSKTCNDRDWYAGKCAGIQEIVDLEDTIGG